MLKKTIRKIISLTIVALLIIFIAISYTVSLIIVKPREIDFLSNIVNQYLSSTDQRLKFTNQKTFLVWNKKTFSIDVTLQNNQIFHDDNLVFSSPNIKLDISRRHLFLGKIKIDSVISDQTLISLPKGQNSALNFKATNPLSLIPNAISNINLKNITVADQNIFINYLNISNNKLSKQRITKLNTEINYGDDIINLSANCFLILNKKENNCSLKFNNLPSDILNLITEKHKVIFLGNKNQINISLTLKNNSLRKTKLQIISDKGLINSAYLSKELTYDILDANLDIVNGIKDFDINELSIRKNKKHIVANIKVRKPDDIYNIAIIAYGENLTEKDLPLLWSNKIPKHQKLRKWLVKSLQKTLITQALMEMDLRILDKKKVKLNKMDGNFKFNDTSIKFSKYFMPINDAKGNIKFTKKKLNIDVQSATAANLEIPKLQISIPEIIKYKSNLIISGEANGHIKNLLNFTLKNNLSQKSFTLLSKNAKTGNSNTSFNIGLKLTPKITANNLQIDLQSKLNNVNYSNLLLNSDILLNVTKQYDNRNFKVNLNLNKSIVNKSLINYHKPKDTALSGNFNIAKKRKYLEIRDVNFQGKETKVKGAFNISASGINYAKFNEIKLQRNNLKLFITPQKKLNKVEIRAEQIDLTNILESINEVRNNKLKFKGKFFAKNIITKSGDKLHNNYAEFICNGSCGFILAESDINETEKLLIKINEANNKKHLTIETNNAGKIIKYLGISDRILSGNLQITASRSLNHIQKIYQGEIFLNKFYIAQIPLFQKLNNLKIFHKTGIELKKSGAISFEIAKGNFLLSKNNIEIKNLATSGNVLGITNHGNINISTGLVTTDGVLAPAYKINSLLGLKHIPIIGEVLTGGKGEGILSARYSVNGNLKKQDLKISINPLSIATPGFLRKAFDLINFNKKKKYSK